MYINQPNVYIAYEELTEEQIKAVKQGYAYRRWKRRNVLTVVLTIVWICSGMFLMNIFPENSIMNNIIFVLYMIGMIVAILVEIRNLRIVCWTCPNCKKQLLKKEIGLGRKYPQPVLSLKCHHCNYDLTQQK